MQKGCLKNKQKCYLWHLCLQLFKSTTLGKFKDKRNTQGQENTQVVENSLKDKKEHSRSRITLMEKKKTSKDKRNIQDKRSTQRQEIPSRTKETHKDKRNTHKNPQGQRNHSYEILIYFIGVPSKLLF